MRFDLIIKNASIVTSRESFSGDIAVSKGKIAKIGSLDPSDTAEEIFDAASLLILPGIIDAHVHFRDPGLTEKEDFETGSAAAAFGGITFAADMPNVLPVTSTVERFNEKARIAREKSYIDFGIFALLANDNTGEIDGLCKAGALGFKVFLGTSTGDVAPPQAGVLFQALEKTAKAGSRVGFHCENSEINSHFTAICKKMTGADGQLLADARPVISEMLAIQNAITYAKYTGAKIHIHHVTSADGASLAAYAKQNGINLTAETCPHYLLLNSNTEKAVRVYPPIRDEVHRKGLWEALKSGVIDMIASDHAPHSAAEKALPLWETPAGVSGVETQVRLMLNEVNKGNLSLNDYVRMASEAPAKVWGIYPKKGSLLAGADADFTVVDMKKKSVIRIDELHSKSRTSVYDGFETQGMPVAAIVRGKFIVRDGELTGAKGYGTLISPELLRN